MTKSIGKLGFKQYFFDHLPECYVAAEALVFPRPQLVYVNQALAETLDADFPADDEQLAQLLTGQSLPDDAKPIAQAYAGHQFGQFNPQLGDGRAMILGELGIKSGGVTELDLKGSGPTPFSRGGDGKAAIGPMLREVLISEAMHALNIPTTRSLSVATTGETVYRNPPQSGAVLARTASSHIRIGSFQYFAARDEQYVVEKLVHFCIRRHYPQLQSSKTPALSLLEQTVKAQAALIAQWMGVGFIHGVMNTDNMLISAETIDFGPCAFMDSYDPNTVFSSIDQRSRYAYSNQPGVAVWNLSRFAETLLPHIHDDKDTAIECATNAVKSFSDEYANQFRNVMATKLGLDSDAPDKERDLVIQSWNELLTHHAVDWTLAHWHLSQYLQDNDKALLSLFPDVSELNSWLGAREKISAKTFERCFAVNPAVIPRNHLVEEALNAASYHNDFAPFKALLERIQQPYSWPSDARFAAPATTEFNSEFVTYCGT